jgi:mannose-1-phosphate guanylyltransferase/phosphomannomutase
VIELGELQYPARVIEKYNKDFLQQLQHQLGTSEPTRQIKIVLDYMFQASQVMLPNLLGQRNIDAIVLNAHVAEGPLRNYDELATQTSDVVRALRANFGARMDANGERMTLIYDRGETIDNNRTLAILVQLLLHKNPGKKIAVPVMAPSLIEEVAARFGGEVIRTKSTTRSLMEAAQQEGVILAGYAGQYIFPSFHPGFDGMMTAAMLATLLSLDDRQLSEMVSDLPPLFTAHEQLPCPTTLKGTLMRLMLERYSSRDISTIDGVKLFEDGGWVLILPDPSLPKVHFYANGSSKEFCHGKIQKYRAEIQEMLESQREKD